MSRTLTASDRSRLIKLASPRIKINHDGTVAVNSDTYTPDNPEQFVEDVEAIFALPYHLTRKEYERLAREYGVKAHPDSKMGDYADKYGDYDWHHFGTYFGNSRNRKQGWESLLKQRRWFEIKASQPSRTLTASDRKRLIKLASTMPAGSEERKVILAGLSKAAKSMDRMEYLDWLRNLAVGDVIEVYWTAGSGGHYHGKARIKKVNRKSVVTELLEEVETYDGQPYPVGNPIRVPTTPWDRRFGEFFNAPMPLGVDVITRPKPGR